MMSTGYCMEVMNHCVVHLQLILQCILSIWNLNKNLNKKIVLRSNRNPLDHITIEICVIIGLGSRDVIQPH